MKALSLGSLLFAATWAAGCADLPADGGSSGGDGASDVGHVQAQLTNAPAGTQCVQVAIVAGGTSTAKAFAVTSGAATQSLDLGVVASGMATFSGKAFTVACGSIAGATPTWIADSVTSTVLTGTLTSVTLVFRQPQATVVTADFRPSVKAIFAACDRSFAILADGSVRTWHATALAPTAYTNFAGAGALKKIAGNCTDTFALAANGTVWRASGTSATQISGLTTAVDLAVGSRSQCALTMAADLYCWGTNSWGEVGNGTVGTVASPTLVIGSIARVGMGYGHTCTVGVRGGVRCWGLASDTRLGFSSASNVLSPGPELASPTAIVAVMPGAESTLAQRADGQYFGWGRNTQGEVGTATTPITTPTPVSALTGATTVVMAEHGNFNLTFACGIFGASATVKCWGNNSAGQLGNGTTTSSPSPTNVSGLSDVAQLSLTTTGTACALTRAGAVKCWGDATGDGTTLRRFLPVDLAL